MNDPNAPTRDAPSAPCCVCGHRYVFAGLHRRGDEWVCWWCDEKTRDPEPTRTATVPAGVIAAPNPPEPSFELTPPPATRPRAKRHKRGAAIPDHVLEAMPENIRTRILKSREAHRGS